VCQNDLETGVYRVEIWVGGCAILYSQPVTVTSGALNTPSYLHVQEVRAGLPVTAGQYLEHPDVKIELSIRYITVKLS